jgi:hypothetical protein
MRASLRERLHAGYIPEPNSGCHLWLKTVNPNSYGMIRDREKVLTAHRVAWMDAHGPIPDGMHVLHKCDVRSCVNPAHMFLGTHAENMDDKARKRRSYTKISDDMVRRIRELASAGMMHKDIAKQLGLIRSSISPIIRGEIRKYV